MWFTLDYSGCTCFQKQRHLFWIPSTMKFYSVLGGEVAIKRYNVLEMILDESNTTVLWDLWEFENLNSS